MLNRFPAFLICFLFSFHLSAQTDTLGVNGWGEFRIGKSFDDVSVFLDTDFNSSFEHSAWEHGYIQDAAVGYFEKQEKYINESKLAHHVYFAKYEKDRGEYLGVSIRNVQVIFDDANKIKTVLLLLDYSIVNLRIAISNIRKQDASCPAYRDSIHYLYEKEKNGYHNALCWNAEFSGVEVDYFMVRFARVGESPESEIALVRNSIMVVPDGFKGIGKLQVGKTFHDVEKYIDPKLPGEYKIDKKNKQFFTFMGMPVDTIMISFDDNGTLFSMRVMIKKTKANEDSLRKRSVAKFGNDTACTFGKDSLTGKLNGAFYCLWDLGTYSYSIGNYETGCCEPVSYEESKCIYIDFYMMQPARW